MKKYHSKIGVEIVGFIAIVLGATSVVMIINHAWAGLAVNIAVVGFISYMFASTYYIIDGNNLLIKCGFAINMTIKIDRITKIVETNNPLSSPAASIDRIAIHYNRKESVMISPKDKMNFIKELTDINPTIEVVLKKNKRQK